MKRHVAVCAAALAAAGVLADDMNYQNYIVGDRAPGMGGAVAASADSVDAAYYNPSGLARSPGNQLSVSANLYGFTASVGRQGKSIGTNLGLSYTFGSGGAVGWEDAGGVPQLATVDARERQYYVFLNTTYVF